MPVPARAAGFPSGNFLDSYDFAEPKGGLVKSEALVAAPFDARVFRVPRRYFARARARARAAAAPARRRGAGASGMPGHAGLM